MITTDQSGLKIFLIYIFGFIFLTLFIYLGIPFFFDYKSSKLDLEKKIFKRFSLNLQSTSEAKYNIFPSPRLHLSNVQILNFTENSDKIGVAKKVVLKVPFKKLINLKSLDFNSIKIINAVVEVKTSEFTSLTQYLNKMINEKPIEIKKSKVNILDKKNLLFSFDLDKVNIKGKKLNNKLSANGKLFNTRLKINYQRKDSDNELFKNVKIGLPDIGLNLKLSINPDENNNNYGTARMFFPSNKIFFDYMLSDKNLNIKNSKIINDYFKGQLYGDLFFFPYSLFDIKLKIDFLKFKNLLDDRRFLRNTNLISQLVPFNKKINGNLNIDINKIVSSSNIINAAKANLEFRNKALMVKQIRLDMNKIGNINLKGKILEQKKKKLFVFNSKIDLKNSQNFYSRFLIPEKNRIELVPINLLGKIDLESYKFDFNEISFENKSELKKMKLEDVQFLQENINEIFSQNSLNNVLKYSNLRKIIQSFFN